MQHMHDGDEIIVFVDGLTEAIKGISDAPTVEKAWKIYDLQKSSHIKTQDEAESLLLTPPSLAGYVQLEGQTYWPTVSDQLDASARCHVWRRHKP